MKPRLLPRRSSRSTTGRAVCEQLEDRRYLHLPSMIGDFAPGIGSSRSGSSGTASGVFAELNNSIYFGAAGAIWKSDGTQSGTQKLCAASPQWIQKIGSALYFATAHGGGGVDLWRSDGSPAGTAVIKTFNALGNIVSGSVSGTSGSVFLSANDGTGWAIWKTGGTAATTARVDHAVHSNIADLICYDSKLYFGDGISVWMSDGTASGTVQVVSLPNLDNVRTSDFVAAHGLVYFLETTPDSDYSEGAPALWCTDGTADGTRMVSESGKMLVAMSGEVYFRTGDDGYGTGLDKVVYNEESDAYDSVETLNSGVIYYDNPGNEVVSENTLYFSGTGGIWKSDGTAAGTKRIQTGTAVPASWLTVSGGELYFAGQNSTYGTELWQSDGTNSGTQLVADIRSGTASSQPSMLTNVNGSVAFVANDGVHGLEPWIYSTGGTLSATATNARTIRLFFSQPLGQPVTPEMKGPSDSNYYVVPGFKASPGTGTTLFDVTGLAPSATYSFRLKSVLNGQPDYSSVISQTTTSDTSGSLTPAPTKAAPTNLLVRPSSLSGTAVSYLTWDNTSGDETGYVIERKTASQPDTAWTSVGSASPDQTSFVDTVPSNTSVYQYRVRATFSGSPSMSAPSNVVLTWFAPLVSPIAVNPNPARSNSIVTVSATVSASTGDADTFSFVWTYTNPSGQAVSVTKSTPTFSFTPDAVGSWTVGLSVTDLNTSFVTSVGPKNIAVSAGSSAVIHGPTMLSEGAVGNYSLSGLIGTPTWTISQDGSVVASGSGTAYAFVPTDVGEFTVTATVGTSSVSLAVNVPYLAPTVQIAGPSIGFQHQPSTFSGKINQTGNTDALAYQWTLLESDGTPYGSLSGESLLDQSATNLATYSTPASLSPGNYQMQLVVTDPHGGTTSQIASTFAFSVLSTTTDPDISWGANIEGNNDFVPYAWPWPFGQAENPGTMVVQPDGKVLETRFDTDGAGESELVRFNSDLSVDRTFGQSHQGVEWLSAGNTQFFPFAMTLTPDGNNVILTGENAWFEPNTTGVTNPVVSEFAIRQYIAADGSIVLPGMPNPAFNNGQPLTIDVGGAIGTAITCSGSGPSYDIYVAGAQYTTQDPSDGLHNYDFFLARLTKSGALDTLFGQSAGSGSLKTGIAQDPVIYGQGQDWPDDFTDHRVPYLFAGVRSIVVADDSVYLGGSFWNQHYNSANHWLTATGDFAIVKYIGGSGSTAGTLDTDFGSDSSGKVITSGTLLGGNVADGSGAIIPGDAVLDAFTVNSDGSLLTAGTVSLGDAISRRVVLARYTSDGVLDSGYTSAGPIIQTSVTEDHPVFSKIQGAFHGFWYEDVAMTFGNESSGALHNALLVSACNSDGSDFVWTITDISTTTGALITSFGSNGIATIPQPQGEIETGYALAGTGLGTVIERNGDVYVGGLIAFYQQNAAIANLPNGPAVFVYHSQPEPAVSRLNAATSSDDTVTLTWDNTGFGTDGFVIHRATTRSGLASASSIIAVADSSQRDFVDVNAQASTTLYYSVVPFTYDSNGTRIYQQTNPASPGPGDAPVATILDANSSFYNTLLETQLVRLDGESSVTSSVLQSGVKYLIVASGEIHLNGDYVVDAAGAALADDESINSQTTGELPYGVALGGIAGVTGTSVLPYWGTKGRDQHTFMYVVEGTGNSLSATLTGPPGFAAYVGSGENPLTIQVFAATGSSTSNAIIHINRTLVQTVPITENTTETSNVLQSGHRYLVEVTGHKQYVPAEFGDQAVLGDADYAWVNGTAQARLSQGLPEANPGHTYGLTITDAGAPSLSIAPASLIPHPFEHQYDYVVVGTGNSLTFSFPSAWTLTQLNSGDEAFAANIYEIADPTLTTSTTSAPQLRIVSPTAQSSSVPSVITDTTPIRIISARSDNSASPWALWLVGSDGTWSPLANDTASAGSLPSSAAVVANLVPAEYADGYYKLTLTSSLSDPQDNIADSRTVKLWSAVKTGAFSHTFTDSALISPIGKLSINRTYNSGRLAQDGDFGPGWSLDLIDSHLTTTSRGDSYSWYNTSEVLRAGDLVAIDLPDGSHHVFEFAPIPVDDANDASAGSDAVLYTSRFIATDGSGVTLTIANQNGPSGFNSEPAAVAELTYDRLHDEFLYKSSHQSFEISYDPTVGFGANPPMEKYDSTPWRFQVTTPAGGSYQIDPSTGLFDFATDSDGNYDQFAYDDDGNVTISASNSNMTLATISRDSTGRISSINTPDGNAVTYRYDINGNLVSVDNPNGDRSSYAYGDPNNVNHLTGITNAQGTTVQQVYYDGLTGLCASVTNVNGIAVPVSQALLGSRGVIQTTTDAVGDTTETLFDERYGNALRRINVVSNSSGTPTSYVVAANVYEFVTDDIGVVSTLQLSGVDILQSITLYPSFRVTGSDSAGSRFTLLPSGGWTRQALYNTSDKSGDPSDGQLLSTSQRLTDGSNPTFKTATYRGYKIVDANTAAVKPTLTVVSVGGHTQSMSLTSYNTSDGTVQFTLKSTVADPSTDNPNGFLAVGTDYSYSGGLETSERDTQGRLSSSGAVLDRWTIGAAKAQNTYYEASDVTSTPPIPGASYRRLEVSTDAAGQQTFYAYDALGRTVLKYVYKSWYDGNVVVNGWVGTTSVYNTVGELTDQYKASYLANPDHTRNGRNIVRTKLDASGNVAVDETIYTAARLIQHNDYNTIGEKIGSVDQYGGVTSYTYDSAGHVLRTVMPNGTETRTVYDGLGRVVWTSSPFVSVNSNTASSANTSVATHSIYDQLGHVIKTETYDGVAIEINSLSAGSVTSSISAAVGGSLISAGESYFDEQGNTIETKNDATGLRTASMYYPDDSVQYSGILQASAVDGGALTTSGGIGETAFALGNFQSYTHITPNQYDATLGLFYKRSADQNGHYNASSNQDSDGHRTDTYTDGTGRTVRTVYDDGSFTETLYSFGDTPVTQDVVPNDITSPAGLSINGGSEIVSIAQRASGCSVASGRITFRLYNAAGQLTDVWLPAVMDSDPDSLTSGSSIQPHWTYLYDTAGNQIAQISPKEQHALHTWMDAGHSAASFTGDTNFVYDQDGNQVSESLPDSTSANPEVETSTYNLDDQIATKTDFDGNLATYTYYTSGVHAGQLQQVVHAGAAGSVKATQTVTYAYDALGRLHSVTDASGYTVNLYDEFNNLVEAETPEGNVHYVFDLATGEHTETYTTYANNDDRSDALADSSYGYDGQGRLTSVTTNDIYQGGVDYETDYAYDAVGNLITESLANGDVSTYGYDDLNRLTSLVEKEGSVQLFLQTYTLNADGTRASSHEVQRQGNGTNVTVNSTWTYDADGRLTSESVTSNASVAESYSNTFGYDLNNNRVKQVHVGPGAGASATTLSLYNGDDEQTDTGPDANGDGTIDPATKTHNDYDANGSLITATTGNTSPTVVTYVYDVRNKLVGYKVNGTTLATYVYDDSGNRVSETANGYTTTYLTDTQNPTGYDQPIQSDADNDDQTHREYILGLTVLGQSEDGNDPYYLLPDGHGSTQAVTNLQGAVSNLYRYDAFGTPINFDPANTSTVFLFGGDAVYNPVSGLYLHGNGVRPTKGSLFTQRDDYAGTNDDPASLHKYLYAEADPVNGTDPTGYFLDLLMSAGDEASEEGEGLSLMGYGEAAKDEIEGGISVLEGVESGYANAAMDSSDDWGASFSVGFASGFTSEALMFATGNCQIANGVGGAILDFGNDVIQNGSGAFSTSGVVEALMMGLVSGLMSNGCFLAGTPVLAGDGETKEPIQDIHVGDRVATDGGVANSPDGKTKASDPNATAVDPKTWREVTIEAGDWEVQTLEPISEIRSEHAKVGGGIDLGEIVDLQEMGAPKGLLGTVESINACPQIQSGTGRVVLTTVNHLNGDVYDLTLKNARGISETMGVTGYHRFYDTTRGWTHVQDLYAGETLRGDHGNLTVVSAAREIGADRVYNMTVEGDHVYYVGNLDALTHNSCTASGVNGQLHHAISNPILAAIEESPNLAGEVPRDVENLITQALDGASHSGYQTWHRELDAEISQAIRNNPNWQPLDFINYLIKRYSESDLLGRFPGGLG